MYRPTLEEAKTAILNAKVAENDQIVESFISDAESYGEFDSKGKLCLYVSEKHLVHDFKLYQNYLK